MDLSSRIPYYLTTKSNTIKLIVFTAIFSLVFINIFEPYNSRAWLHDMSDFKYFVLSSVLVLLGMAVVAISRVIMYRKFGSKGHRLRLWQFLLWVAAEILAMSLTFSIFEMTAMRDERCFLDLIRIALRNTSFVLLLPYSVLWLYFSWDDKNKRLLRINESYNSGDDASAKDKLMMINFYDSKGDIKFSVKLLDLMYIKGADNYITVYYKDGQKLSSVMIRNTMKQAEADLKPKGIIRCHKSYMVNSKHIKTLERKDGGVMIRLEAPLPLQIPITKSYVKDVYELL
ncbi:MAG: LytTR family transcriptional regulator [Bacteroidales bacterium]|nr:LytTR family transcriptional regulator [Bacteroidales bacterium]